MNIRYPLLLTLLAALLSASWSAAANPASGFLTNGVTAHRGNSGDHPENTIPSFRSAIELGADWIELDVHRTSDGRLVVCHDTTTLRVGDRDLVIAETSYADLRRVDVAAGFRRERPKLQGRPDKHTMPLLEEVLRLVMSQNRTRASIQPKVDCVAEAIAVVKQLGAEEWVGFNDANLELMAKVKKLAPSIPVFWDRHKAEIEQDINIANRHGFQALVLHFSLVTEERVRAVKDAGLEVGVWTVNDEQAMERFLRYGVDRIYTDYPERLLAVQRARTLSSAAASRPNILWLVSEDNTTYLGCYGDKTARTPVLDKMAKEGVLYERCFSQPVCAPSRFTLITGMPAIACGPANNMRAQGIMPSFLKGFPFYLRQAGYYTANNSKTDYNAPINMKETWNESSRQAHYKNRPDPSQPFFSVFNHEVTHESCLFPERDVPLGFTPTEPSKVRVPAYMPDTPEIRTDIARYYDHIALMDGQIGAKLKELEESGLAQDTIVFYYADNGGVLPRSKRFLQRSGTHVPLIVRFPEKWRHLAPAAPGSQWKHPVSFVDFAPTILSLAGIKAPSHMAGRSFAGPSLATNEFVFCTRDRMDEQYDTVRSVVDERWLYIRNFRPDLRYVYPIDYMFRARGYQSWARLASAGKLTPETERFWGEKPVEELYDLTLDPDNVRNLAEDTSQQAVLRRMRAALAARVAETRDNGFVPEGSPEQSYDAARRDNAWSAQKVFKMACIASERNPTNLNALIAGLKHDSAPVRWWAAQGCAMLRKEAAPASDLLHAIMTRDPSGPIQIAAAESLAWLGNDKAALPVLEKWVLNKENSAYALQAANVLDRLGPIAKVTKEKAKTLLQELPPEKGGRTENYITRILQRF